MGDVGDPTDSDPSDTEGATGKTVTAPAASDEGTQRGESCNRQGHLALVPHAQSKISRILQPSTEVRGEEGNDAKQAYVSFTGASVKGCHNFREVARIRALRHNEGKPLTRDHQRVLGLFQLTKLNRGTLPCDWLLREYNQAWHSRAPKMEWSTLTCFQKLHRTFARSLHECSLSIFMYDMMSFRPKTQADRTFNSLRVDITVIHNGFFHEHGQREGKNPRSTSWQSTPVLQQILLRGPRGQKPSSKRQLSERLSSNGTCSLLSRVLLPLAGSMYRTLGSDTQALTEAMGVRRVEFKCDMRLGAPGIRKSGNGTPTPPLLLRAAADDLSAHLAPSLSMKSPLGTRRRKPHPRQCPSNKLRTRIWR